MNNLQQVMKEAREALEKATPGPWSFAVMEDSRHVIYDHTYFNRHIAEIVRGGVESEQREEDNADLIANAPTWLSTLLSGLEEAQRKIEKLKHELFNARSLRDFAVKRANEALTTNKDRVTCNDCVDGEIYWEDGDDLHGGPCPTCSKEESQ